MFIGVGDFAVVDGPEAGVGLSVVVILVVVVATPTAAADMLVGQNPTRNCLFSGCDSYVLEHVDPFRTDRGG